MIPTQPPPRVLIVDDDVQVGKVLTHLLNHGHFLTTFVTSAKEASKLLLEHGDNFAAVLVDLFMENMHGLELVELLQTIDHHLPAIVFTAYATPDIAEQARAVGAYAVIEKADSDLLYKTVAQACARTCRLDDALADIRSSLKRIGDLADLLDRAYHRA